MCSPAWNSRAAVRAVASSLAAAFGAFALASAAGCGAGATTAPAREPGTEPSGASSVLGDTGAWAWVVSPRVDRSWLGATWDGSPARLGASADAAPAPGACGPAREHGAPPELGEAGRADATPPDGWFPRSSAWLLAAGCAPSPDTWRVTAIGAGAFMRYEGAPAGLSTPDEVLRAGGELREAWGWVVRDGAWGAGDAWGVALLQRESESADPCGAGDGPDLADALATAILTERLAAPDAAARATATLERFAASLGGAAGLALRGELDEIPAGCTGSRALSVARLRRAEAVPSSGSSESDARVAPDALGLGPAEDALLALAALDAGALELARLHVSAALARSPHHAHASLVAALVGRKAGDPNARVRAALVAAAEDPALYARAAFELGLLAEELGDLEAAEDWMQAAHDADSGYADPANALGFLAISAGNTERGRLWLARALERDAGHAGANNNAGWVAERADDDPVAAERWYQRALRSDPESVSATFNLASVRERRLGLLEEAEQGYERVLALEPTHPGARSALEALRARPSASVAALTGAWSGTDPDGASVVVTVDADGLLAIVARPAEGAGTTARHSIEVLWARGCRLSIARDGAEPLVFEFLDRDRVAMYPADDPAHARTVLTRRSGTDSADLGRPVGAGEGALEHGVARDALEAHELEPGRDAQLELVAVAAP